MALVGELKVNPETLEARAEDFASKDSQMKAITDQMIELVNGLKGIWEGEASTAFYNKFHELDDDIQRMHNMVQEHSKDLIEMARVYREADTFAATESAALSGSVIE